MPDIAVTLTKRATTSVASFGVPLASGVATAVSQFELRVAGSPITSNVEARLKWWNSAGVETGLRSVLIQFDATTHFPGAVGTTLDVVVRIGAVGAYTPGSTILPFADVSFASDQTCQVCEWDIQGTPGTYALVATNTRDFTHFPARLPAVTAHFADSYLTGSRILGQLISAAEVAANADLAGLRVISDYLKVISEYSVHDTSYINSSDMENGIWDYTNVLNTDANSYWYDRWLYDRTATLLLAAMYENDDDLLMHAYRHGYYYATTIYLSGSVWGIPLRGGSSVKLRTRFGIVETPTIPDEKYSKARGLLAYYALTGDEAAAAAVTAIADMWIDTTNITQASVFAVAYRGGSIGSYSSIFTERLLGCCMEGLLYGYLATGTVAYLTAFEEMLDTAYRHATTTDQAELNAITMPYTTFIWPPQDTWIHNGNQHREGSATQPVTSVWMADLCIDPLLWYHYLTDDVRIPDLFIHITRYIRDTASCYRSAASGSQLNDRFLHPLESAALVGGRYRMIEPPYIVGQNELSVREKVGGGFDRLHAPDTCGMIACGIYSLVQTGAYISSTVNGTFCAGYGGFANEGETFVAMLHEFLAQSQFLFAGIAPQTVDGYDWVPTYVPDVPTGGWTSDALAPGAADPATFIKARKIGYRAWAIFPNRKASWWFNATMFMYALADEMHLEVTALQAPGIVDLGGVLHWTAPPTPYLLETPYGQPISDISVGSWTPSVVGAPLYTMIDETTASDTDYITSSVAPVNDGALMGLADLGTPTGGMVTLSIRGKLEAL